MIKFLKKLWNKLFGKKEVIVMSQPAPQPKPLHCKAHSRFRKSCPNCQEIIK